MAEQEHKALYRKYRPARFSDVIGQEHVTTVLQYQITHDRVAHAYMFTGSRGTGKTTCARILAKAINCESPVNGDPCGCCPACRAIDAGLAPDVSEINAGSQTKVEDMRDLLDTVVYAPTMLKKRVIILDEVHMLSASASNALLKTLEEPPDHTIFILATTDLYKVIPTILSRCQRFDFRRLDLRSITTRLKYIAEQESILLEDDAAQRIASLAQGGMRDAIQMFELCAGGGADVTMERVENYLGVSHYDLLCKTALAVAAGDVKTIFAIVEEASSSAKDISVFWQELVSFYRDMLVAKYCADPADYLDLTSREQELVTSAAAKFSVPLLNWHAGILSETLSAVNRAPQMKRTLVEFALVRMSDPKLNATPEAMAARIDALENKLALLGTGVSPALSPARRDEPAPAKPQTSAPSEPPAPRETKPQEPQERYDLLADTSELADKLDSMGQKQLKSFLDQIEIYISEDGTKARIVCDGFSYIMFCEEKSREFMGQALAVCSITSGIPSIAVEKKKPSAEKQSGQSEAWFDASAQQ